jgi:excisionase family DNA binding protein
MHRFPVCLSFLVFERSCRTSETDMKDTHTSLPRLAISVAEFCEIFSIGRSTFYEEVKAGRLKVRKVGVRTLVPSAEAQAWWEDRRH